MAATREGGKLTAERLKKKYGADYYARLGAVGGKKTGRKGFAVSNKAASAGAKGGAKSKRVYTDADRQRMSEIMKERWASGGYRKG